MQIHRSEYLRPLPFVLTFVVIISFSLSLRSQSFHLLSFPWPTLSLNIVCSDKSNYTKTRAQIAANSGAWLGGGKNYEAIFKGCVSTISHTVQAIQSR